MIIKNIEISSFQQGHRAYHIAKDGKFYCIKYKEVTDPDLPFYLDSDLLIYNEEGTLEKSFPLTEMHQDISNFYALQENEPDAIEVITDLYVHENQFIITTETNRTYVYEDDKIAFKHAYDGEKTDHRLDDIIIQNANLAGHLFKEKNGRIYLLTQGKSSGKFNRRDRYIVSLTENPFDGIKENVPHSIYLTDVRKNLLGKEEENKSEGFWIPGMRPIQNPNSLNHRIDLYDPMIFQVVDLNNENCLISVFSDSRSKSATPDSHTPYYFIVLNKDTGIVKRMVHLKDGSVYKKDFHYMIVDDIENNRLIFKTFENVYLLNYDGDIIEKMNLSEHNLSRFKKLRLLGTSKKALYFYDAEHKILRTALLAADKTALVKNIH